MTERSGLKRFYVYRLILAVIILALLAGIILTLACADGATQKTTQSSDASSSNGLIIRYLPIPNQVQPSRVIEILCVATDSQNSPLTYVWSASAGEIKPQEDPESIKWLSPIEVGIYTVTVVVSNDRGDKVQKTVDINVTDEEPQHPVIYTVKCENCTKNIEASRFSEYTLRCDAIDPNNDELRYVWFANLGKIEAQGEYAIWTTGAQFGNALITVIVTDSQGNEATGYLAINVACCNK
ncbi:MAG TPA: hypothetical protein VJ488_05750 [Dehalococcoidia bacterium]|nr:hypothetical protein [Dehalococcoidia bacterium]